MVDVLTLLAVVAAYVVGSIPSGFLLARRAGLDDIRKYGSGNTGAMNVLRTLGWRAALPVLVLDALKGAIGVLLVRLAGGGPEWQALGGVMAMVGHIFPFTLNFRGGRGVATGIGVLLMLDPVAGVVSAISFILIVAVSRYVSLGSIGAGLPGIVALYLRGAPPAELVVVALGIGLIIWRHAPNIARLRAGTEHRFSPRPPAHVTPR